MSSTGGPRPPTAHATGRFARREDESSRAAWDLLASGPHGHIRQCLWWAQPLEPLGVRHDVVANGGDGILTAGALVRSVQVPHLPIAMGECLHGPVATAWDGSSAALLLASLDEVARRRHLVELSFRGCADATIHQSLADGLRARGARWTTSTAPDDAVVSLEGRTLDEVRAGYHRTTRRWVRQASSNSDLTVEQLTTDADLRRALEAFEATRKRKGFTDLRPATALHPVLRSGIDAGHASVFGAKVDGVVVAATFVSFVGRRALFLYGGYRDGSEALRPNHVLHDAAMAEALSRQLDAYDLGTLPAIDHLPHLRRFKLGFGAHPVRTLDTITWACQPRTARVVAALRATGWDRRLLATIRRDARRLAEAGNRG